MKVVGLVLIFGLPYLRLFEIRPDVVYCVVPYRECRLRELDFSDSCVLKAVFRDQETYDDHIGKCRFGSVRR